MEIVAGLSLKNLQPRVWDPKSEYFLKRLSAVMVSYADFKQMRARRRAVMKLGLKAFLAAPKGIQVYLDNGAYFFANNGGEPTAREYWDFIKHAQPDWRPIRFDAIPSPSMSPESQLDCYRRTMAVNRSYQHDGYVPVVHAGKHLRSYIDAIAESPKLDAKDCIALGGLVPNLLRTPKAATYGSILDDLITVRDRFPKKRIHVFGIGGTATLHLAALLGFDSVDSSGWRNRAARGIVQLPGSGERIVASLGNWRGRRPNRKEWKSLKCCGCPACKQFGVDGLKKKKLAGFCNRATHNLWVLLEEARWIDERLQQGTYRRCYKRRLNNTIYLPLIEEVLRRLSLSRGAQASLA